MKSSKANAIVMAILFILVSGVIAAAGYFYFVEYQQKIAYLTGEGEGVKSKLKMIDGNLESFKYSLDALKSRNEEMVQKVKSFEEEISLSKNSRENIKLALEEIHTTISNWSEEYSQTISEIRGKVEALKQNVSLTEESIAKNVELGKVSVTKNTESAEEANKTEDAGVAAGINTQGNEQPGNAQ